MLHLFHNVYVDFDFNLSQYNQVIISQTYKDTFVRRGDETNMVAGSYAELVDNYFDGDENTFWTFLYSIPPTEKVVVHIHEEEFLLFIVKYFRALFNKASDSGVYTMYRLSVLRHKLMVSQLTYIDSDIRDLYYNLPLLTIAEFAKQATKISRIDPFPESVKQAVSIEYLLPSFLNKDNTKYDSEFESRAKLIIGFNIIDEIEELKQNMLNGFFDLNNIYRNLPQLDFNTATFDELVKNTPRLKFLFDRNIERKDLAYLAENYNISNIFSVYREYSDFIDSEPGVNDRFLQLYEDFANGHKTVRDLVDVDIATGVGTQIFVRASYVEKFNPFIISYFYRLERERKEQLNIYTL